MILYLNVFMVSIFNMPILAELSPDEEFNLKDTSGDNHMISIIPNNDNILIHISNFLTCILHVYTNI
jgi:hypothetical protein